jgi:hypothetical protein
MDQCKKLVLYIVVTYIYDMIDSILTQNSPLMCCEYFHAPAMIDWLLFYVSLKIFSLKWRCHHCWWRALKFRPMLGAQGLWASMNIVLHLLWHGALVFPVSSEGSPHLVASYNTQKDVEDLYLNPHRFPIQSPLTTHKGMWRIYSNLDPHMWLWNEPFLAKRIKKLISAEIWMTENKHDSSIMIVKTTDCQLMIMSISWHFKKIEKHKGPFLSSSQAKGDDLWCFLIFTLVRSSRHLLSIL